MQKTSESDWSFCQAIQLGEYSLAVDLCKHGVSRKDLQFATSWLLLGNADHETFSIMCCGLDSNDRVWLQQYAVRLTMKEYFKKKSDTSLENFIKQFSNCFDETFTRDIYKNAIRKSVKFDRADCFVTPCKKQFQTYGSPMNITRQEDYIFAYTSAISGRKPHFISKVCKERIAGQSGSALNELQLLLDIIMEEKAWNVLPGLIDSVPSKDLLKLLEKCVHIMLSDSSVWPIAPALDLWIRANDLGYPETVVDSVHQSTVQQQWSVSLSSLKQWCVGSGHANLVFFLALVTEDLELLETVVNTQTSLDIHFNMLRGALTLAAEKHAFSAGAAVLKICPINAESVRIMDPPYHVKEQLAKACEDQGLLDWALLFQECNFAYILEHHKSSQNHIVLNRLLRTATITIDGSWDVIRELMTRCGEADILKFVLQNAVKNGQMDIAEAVICRVDPTTCVARMDRSGETLLFSAVEDPGNESKMKMVNLCIASGLSTFQRDIHFEENVFTMSGDHCPMLRALCSRNLQIIELMLASGAYSFKRLHKIRIDDGMQRRLKSSSTSEEWKTGYNRMVEAAATPSRLEHMARLAVSHIIGCQPGRTERIQDLPLPEPLKDLLKFKDVLALAKENNNNNS